MNKYEVLYIIDNDVDEEAKNGIVNKFSALIESLGGTVSSVNKWGTKKYAYPINYKTEGYYVCMSFEAAGSAIAELERQMRNNESIIRELVTAVVE